MTGPRALPYAQQLVVVDYRRKTTQSGAAADGACTAALDQVPQGETWLVDRMVVQCTSSTETVARVYAGGVRDSAFVDGTIAGNLDVADESQPILVDSGDALVCVWSDASDGAVGTFSVQYRLVQRRGAFVEG